MDNIPDFVCGYPDSTFLPITPKKYDNAEKYIELLTSSIYALNIPTILGANFRDLEGPACGCILITKRTPDHDLMGFEDGKTCYYYDDPSEIPKILEKPYNPNIALMGALLVLSQNRPIHRIPYIEQIMMSLGVKPLCYEKLWRFVKDDTSTINNIEMLDKDGNVVSVLRNLLNMRLS
jgi:hypothetical protein